MMKNADLVTDFMGGLIQHGYYNNRIYLIKPPVNVTSDFVDSLINLAERKKYTKIFIKTKGKDSRMFRNKGFIKEALIHDFFNNTEDAVFMAFYLDKRRMIDRDCDKHGQIIASCSNENKELPVLEKGYKIIKCSEKNIPQLSSIYRKIFSSYPFPVFDENYLKRTMNSNVDYFGVEKNSELVAVSSSEKDVCSRNAEMTDFATLAEYRRKGFSQLLLREMENEMKREGIKTLYTIARAASYGMNISFSKLDYKYNGRLINNTQICGSLESMNVWSKHLNN